MGHDRGEPRHYPWTFRRTGRAGCEVELNIQVQTGREVAQLQDAGPRSVVCGTPSPAQGP